jgi:uncharacterized Tic20 family protein
MPFAVICPGCKAKIKVPDALLGKVFKCPGCSVGVRVPVMSLPNPGIRQGPARPPAGPVVERLEEVTDEDDIVDVLPAEQTDDDLVEEVGDAAEVVDDLEVVNRKRPKQREKRARGVTENDRMLSMLLYLSSFLFGFFGPLVFWLVKKDESPFISHHGKSALNFLFSLLIPTVFAFGFGFAMTLALGGAAFAIWVLLWIAFAFLSLYSIVMIFIAAFKAKDGEWFELPTWLRLFE